MNRHNYLLYGQSDPPGKLMHFHAGNLQIAFDPSIGSVRQIRFGGHEILTSIYAAVRDHNWDTAPAFLSELSHSATPEMFEIEFLSTHRKDEIHFEWRGLIRGSAEGTLTFDFDGIARSAFRKNRVGFCVLHPLSCAGASARQFRADETVIPARFPQLIEPQIFGKASFQNLRGVAHEIEPGAWAEVSFEGEIFEMEDQRNWTDASFKTYCTPLARPFPVEVAAGTRIRQKVSLRVQPPATMEVISTPAAEQGMVRLIIPEVRSFPQCEVGLGMAHHRRPLTEQELARLQALHLNHLRVDVRLAETDWRQVLQQAREQALSLGTNLEIALHLPKSRGQELSALAAEIGNQTPISRILVMREGEAATSTSSLAEVRAALGHLGVPLGAGSDGNFAELNRGQALGEVPVDQADFLFWAINPQVHAFDSLSLFENLRAQGDTLATARAFSGNQPLVISPVTLKQRFNPVATGPAVPTPPGELPPQADPRQMSLLGAAWTVGSIAALLRSGAASCTYYETTGLRGIMETAEGSACPEKFPSTPGMLFPVYHVMKALRVVPNPVAASTTSPEKIAAIAGIVGGQIAHLTVANLTPEPVRFDAGFQFNKVRMLDEESVESAARTESLPARERARELTMKGYAVAFLEA